jgi:tetratricopeptide (TPR) repeat protein
MVLCLSQVGDFVAGVAYGNAALQLAEAGERPYERLVASWRLGTLYVYQGTLPLAIPLLERTVALLQETNVPLYYRPALVTLAWAYALAGRVPDALAMLEQVGVQMDQVNLNVPLACGEAYLRTGSVEVAHRLAQRVLADARQRKARGWEAWAWWLLGEVAMHGAPVDMASAEAHYRQSLTLAEELGMRPRQAHCHLGLGTLYARTGQRAQAGVALSTAIELYHAMEMPFWLPQAEAALAQVTCSRGPATMVDGAALTVSAPLPTTCSR